MIPHSEWKWFGKACHLVVGHNCRFHLATVIGDYLVSTVGEYMPPETVQEIMAESRGFKLTEIGDAREEEFLRKNGGYERIGSDRLYETMVFRVQGFCTESPCDCGEPIIDGAELLFDAYNDAPAARVGHLNICERIASGVEKLRKLGQA